MRYANAAVAALVLLLAGTAHGQDKGSSTPSDISSADIQPSPTLTPTPTPTDGSSSLPSSTSTGYPDSDLDSTTRCEPDQLVVGPFCEPKPQDVWRTDGNYYVTWDNDRWNLNSTVYLTLNYADPGEAGRLAESFTFSNARGFFTIVRLSPSSLELLLTHPHTLLHPTLTFSPSLSAPHSHPAPHPHPRLPLGSSHSLPLPRLTPSYTSTPPPSRLADGWLCSNPRETGC